MLVSALLAAALLPLSATSSSAAPGDLFYWDNFTNYASGKCLDGWDGYGANPQMIPCIGGNRNQAWYLVDQGAFVKRGPSGDGRSCLDGFAGAGQRPYRQSCTAGNDYQKWERTSVRSSSRTFLLRNRGSGLCLDAYEGFGYAPYMAPCDSSNNNQRWRY